ncbi:MAG: CoA pyrophosphatase [Deltaproteobacteria bacterium]|nr:CoA pyrophosphatase [Deltaproteobacteria bacterium]
MNNIELIKDLLSARTPRSIQDDDPTFVHAAVLIPLFIENGGYKILFTKRTDRVEHHKGQISFPGGVVDEEDDSLEDTALREAYEEVGLLKEDVKILGQIDDTPTVVSQFIIHPFVGLIPYPYDFIINTEEVKWLIKVPFEVFSPDNSVHGGDAFEFQRITYRGPAYQYCDDTIWGATARIMENFIEVVGEKLNLPLEKG